MKTTTSFHELLLYLLYNKRVNYPATVQILKDTAYNTTTEGFRRDRNIVQRYNVVWTTRLKTCIGGSLYQEAPSSLYEECRTRLY